MFQTISNPLAAPLVVLATFLSVGMLPAVAAEEYPYHEHHYGGHNNNPYAYGDGYYNDGFKHVFQRQDFLGQLDVETALRYTLLLGVFGTVVAFGVNMWVMNARQEDFCNAIDNLANMPLSNGTSIADFTLNTMITNANANRCERNRLNIFP